MKRLVLFLLVGAPCMAFLLKHPPLPEYGKPGRDTIAVSVYGEGVVHEGAYHVKKGTMLAHVILAAGSPPADGTYRIELINGWARKPYRRALSFDRSKRPVVEDIMLLDRDEVVFYRTQNQPVETTRGTKP